MGHRFHGRTYVSECVCLVCHVLIILHEQEPCVESLRRTYVRDPPVCWRASFMLLCLVLSIFFFHVYVLRVTCTNWYARACGSIGMCGILIRASIQLLLVGKTIAYVRTQWTYIKPPRVHVSGDVIRIHTSRRRFDSGRDSAYRRM